MQGPRIRNTAARVPAAALALLLALTSTVACAHNPHDPVMALGISPDYANDKTLYLSTFPEWNWGYKDIERSTDGGNTWTKLPKGLDNRTPISAIRLSPGFALDNTLYAATNGEGVYVSKNRGDSWQLFNTGLTGKNVVEMKVGGSQYGAHTLFLAPTTGGLYRRISTQSAWTRVLGTSIMIKVIAPSPDFSTDLTVLAADDQGELWMSTDGGGSWVDHGKPAAAVIYDMAVAPGGAKEIFLATSRSGIFYSADSGKTFSNIVANLPAEAVNNVAVSPNYKIDHTVFCTTLTQSVYKSTNAGASWTLAPTGAVIVTQTTTLDNFAELQVSNTYATDGAVFLSAFDGLFVSSKAGTAWAQRQTRVGLVTALAFSTNFASDHRVMASNYAEGGLYSSANRGSTWTRVWDGWRLNGTTLSSFAMEFVRNHTGPPMAVATKNYSQLGSTSNFGSTWRVSTIPDIPNATEIMSPVYPDSMSVSPQFDQDREIFLGTRSQGVLHSTDGGTSWVASPDVPTAQEILTTATSPDYGHDHTAIVVTTDGQVWRTASSGSNWVRVGATAIKLRSRQLAPWVEFSPNVAVDHLVLLATNNGVYFSVDGGAMWKGLANATFGPSTIIQQVEFSPSFATDHKVYINVRGRGLYRATMSATGVVTSSTNIGQSLLDQHVQFNVFRLSPTFSQDGTILGASGRNVYRSTDGGDTWVLAGSPRT